MGTVGFSVRKLVRGACCIWFAGWGMWLSVTRLGYEAEFAQWKAHLQQGKKKETGDGNRTKA